jgi:hypothetical protein
VFLENERYKREGYDCQSQFRVEISYFFDSCAPGAGNLFPAGPLGVRCSDRSVWRIS